MALSDIKDEKAFEVYAAMIAPMSRIAKDKDVVAAYTVDKPDGIDPRTFMVDMLAVVLPLVMTRYRDELVQILAAIDGKDPSEYVFETFEDVADLSVRAKSILCDKVFLNFLR